MIDLGIIGLLNKGEYSSLETYEKGNFVLSAGSSYVALKDVPVGTAPPNAEYWQVLAQGGEGAEGLTAADIADNLTTSSSDKVLSAAQGVVLKSAVDGKLATSNIANNLTTTASGKALDARQGKALNDALTTTNGTLSTATSNISAIQSAMANHNWTGWGDSSPIYYTIKSGIAFLSIAGKQITINSPGVFTKIAADYIPSGYRLSGGAIFVPMIAMNNNSSPTSIRHVLVKIDNLGDIQCLADIALSGWYLYGLASYPAA